MTTTTTTREHSRPSAEGPRSTGTRPDARAHRPHRMNPLRALRHGLTLTWRSLLKIRRNPEQLMDVTLMPIIFILLFVFVFGGAISTDGDWRTYLQYVLPGLMVWNGVFATMGTGVSLNTDIDKGVFDRFRSLPIARTGPLTGAIFGDFVRYTLGMAVFVGFGAVLGFDFTGGWFGALAACLLVLVFSLCLCWAWVWLGLTVRKPSSVQSFGFLLLMPLTFGSNVFVSTETLPGPMQAFVNVNPVTHLTEATRVLMLEGRIGTAAGWTLLWGVALLVVFVPLALRAYRRRT